MIRFILALPFMLLSMAVMLAGAPLFWLARLSSRTAILLRGDDDMHLSLIDWAHDVVVHFTFKGGFPKQKREIIIYNVYCEAQGPGAVGADDHLLGQTPAFATRDVKVFGEPDVHGGQRVSVDGKSIGCPTCAAPIRQFRVKS
jgi:hypothetical protein